jgi:DNA polymerase-2
MHRGQVIQSTYRIRQGRPVVQLWGRLESGEPFLVEDDRERPYFLLPRDQARLLADAPDAEVAPCALRDFAGRPLVRVTLPIPSAAPAVRDRLRRAGADPLEADLRFAVRYLIDRDIRATVEIRGERSDRERLAHFFNPAVSAADARVALTTLSLDLETSPTAGELYSAAIAGCGVEEVLVTAPREVRGAVRVADERALARALVERIRALDPDVLLGWAVVDFDLRVLVSRCEALGVRCALGREGDVPRFQPDPGFQRRTRADLAGRVVLDGIDLVRDAIRLPDYRLETVAQHVLGRGKKIDQSADNKALEIQRMWRDDPESLCQYNLEDARLVDDLLRKEGLLDLAIERSRLSGMPLDRVGASIASFDRLYLPALHQRGIAAPSVDPERKSEMIRGGALLDPQPGFFEHVAVLDWKSLYPSLIRTFHLDPLAHARAESGEGEDPPPGGAIVAPNGARFSRDEAILPGVIERFMHSRAAARERGDRHADQAIKIMMNAMSGVLGAASCRFFDPAVANAITSFGQQTLAWTRDTFEGLGVPVIYGDTDSVFVLLPADACSTGHAESLRERAERRISARIREAYDVEPQLVLELEKIFDRFWLPRVRGRGAGRSGSKKRYAGWTDGRLVMTGLESVRRDWPDVATRLQEGMLERLFTDRPVASFVRETVESVRQGELDAELVYAKRLRKGSLDRYKGSAPPHVQAARKLRRPGRSVRYVITATGPEPVRTGEPLPPAIDRGHYVEKVLRPVAESILGDVGSSFDEAIGNPTQLPLF